MRNHSLKFKTYISIKRYMSILEREETMNYNGIIYRPPIEANTFLLPITEGCTHNSCSFCNMYKEIPFRMWQLSEVEKYLSEVRDSYGPYLNQIDRVYLVGADPFALSAKYLLERIELIKQYIPNVKVITMYARIDNIENKTDDELIALKEAGINDLYIGIESGLDSVLSHMNKGFDVKSIKEQCVRLNNVGIRHCDLLMLGTGGRDNGHEAALAAAELENEINPTKILVTSMSAFEGTKLDDEVKEGKFTLASEKEMLQEEYDLLNNLNLPNTYFWAMHSLDAVGIAGNIQSSKQDMLQKLKSSMRNIQEDSYIRQGRKGTL